MSRLTKSYHESLLQALQDPQEAAAYLTAALEEGDSGSFLSECR
jgi:DNA-binding phage protein